MQQRGWKSDDLLYAKAMRARDGVLSLLGTLDEMEKERDKPQWLGSRGRKRGSTRSVATAKRFDVFLIESRSQASWSFDAI